MTTVRRPRFYVAHDAVVANRAVLSGDERHHLRVRRIRVGAQIEVFDDRGREFDATVEVLTEERAELSLRERPTRNRESPLDLTLAIALLKADKVDLVVEKVTELGVTRIVTFTCARAVGGASPRRSERWQRIAVSAAKQCSRSRIPAIEGPEPLTTTITRAADVKLLCWEGAETSAPLPERARVSSVVVVVGPEGGFTADEVACFERAEFQIISLGPRILRAETAAIAATTLAQRQWGDL